MSELTTRHPAWKRLESPWKLARLGRHETLPEAWIRASVPGAVQLDWARAHALPDYTYGRNFRTYEGLEDFHWLYRIKVPNSPRAKGEQLAFVCGGVDYACEVRLGGKFALRHEGMFTPFEVDVSNCPPGTDLDILVFPAPKRQATPADHTQASHVCKPAVSYGWDWHPRLIPLGIWAESGFFDRPVSHIRTVDFSYALSADFSSAAITVKVAAVGPSEEVRWRLLDPEGKAAVESSSPEATIANPRLWWTHDQGEPVLYTLEVELSGGDVHRGRVGFRRIRLVMAEGGWDGGAGLPQSRNNPPATVELNGRAIFAKGSNWVNPEIFPGKIDEGVLRPLLELARGANFNLLRAWGGAPVNPEAFFDLCDELGLLVWQEFPLACNLYPDDGDYLRVLDQESRSIIGRVRQHPCLALWCGGNELFNAWSRMTDQSLPLRLLGGNCYELDPSTPFIATAPLGGMGHGDYRFRNEKGQDVFEIFQKAGNTAYSEFGCPGPSPVDYLQTFIPEEELWPPKPDTSWEDHHAFGAWAGDPSSWLMLPTLEHYFGKAGSLEELVAQGTWLQCAGYQAIYEEARRQKPVCSMALSWCYNEPWPGAAGNSLVNWPAVPKKAYFAAQAACRAVLASARIPKFQWRAGETFTAEIWILNDAPGVSPGGEVEAALLVGNSATPLVKWTFPALEPGRNLAGPTVEVILPAAAVREFLLVLSVTPHKAWTSRYRLSLIGAD